MDHQRPPYRYQQAGHFEAPYWSALDAIQSGALRPIFFAYAQNMNRVVALHRLLMDGVFWASFSGWALNGTPMLTGNPEQDALNAGGREGLSAYTQRVARGYRQLTRNGEAVAQDGVYSIASAFIQYMRDSTTAPDVGDAGVEALFYSMVLNSYAAFEVLATDLWIESHNIDPNIFRSEGSRAGKPRTLQLRTEASNEASPGAFLKSKPNGNVTFGSERSILEAYGDSFGYSSPVYGVLSQNADIWDVSVVRHLIAHRSGFVDQKFKSDLKGFPQLATAEINRPLQVDGAMVRDLINTCVKTAVDLIKAVDAWTQNHAGTTSNPILGTIP